VSTDEKSFELYEDQRQKVRDSFTRLLVVIAIVMLMLFVAVSVSLEITALTVSAFALGVLATKVWKSDFAAPAQK